MARDCEALSILFQHLGNTDYIEGINRTNTAIMGEKTDEYSLSGYVKNKYNVSESDILIDTGFRGSIFDIMKNCGLKFNGYLLSADFGSNYNVVPGIDNSDDWRSSILRLEYAPKRHYVSFAEASEDKDSLSGPIVGRANRRKEQEDDKNIDEINTAFGYLVGIVLEMSKELPKQERKEVKESLKKLMEQDYLKAIKYEIFIKQLQVLEGSRNELNMEDLAAGKAKTLGQYIEIRKKQKRSRRRSPEEIAELFGD